jgi:hypothetical protein
MGRSRAEGYDILHRSIMRGTICIGRSRAEGYDGRGRTREVERVDDVRAGGVGVQLVLTHSPRHVGPDGYMIPQSFSTTTSGVESPRVSRVLSPCIETCASALT